MSFVRLATVRVARTTETTKKYTRTKLKKNVIPFSTDSSEGGDASEIQRYRTGHGAEDEEKGHVEGGSTQPHVWVYEKRGDPDHEQRSDREPIHLHVEREIERDRVSSDRDEEHDRDQ